MATNGALQLTPNSAFQSICSIVLVAGAPDKVNDFVELVRPYGIADLVKSGRVALARDQKSRKLRTT